MKTATHHYDFRFNFFLNRQVSREDMHIIIKALGEGSNVIEMGWWDGGPAEVD